MSATDPKNRPDRTVDDLAALAQVHVSELKDGSEAWVISEEESYVLIKNSPLAADGTNVIKPLPGSPSAGAPGAVWVLENLQEGLQKNDPVVLVFNNIAAMAAFNTHVLSTGTIAYVKTVRDFFDLRKESTAVPDGISIVQPTDSVVGRWLRMLISSLDWYQQPDWHINEITGNDENDGATAATALKNHTELERRMGDGPVFVNMTVFIDSDLNQDININWKVQGNNPNALALAYVGQRTVISSGIVDAAQNFDVSTQTDGQITSNAIPVSWSASGFVGKMIEFPNHPGPFPPSFTNLAAWGFIAKDLGAKTARVSPIFDFFTFAIPFNPPVGEPFNIVDITKVNKFVVNLSGGLGYSLDIFNLHVTGTGVSSGPIQSVGEVFFRVGDGASGAFSCIFGGDPAHTLPVIEITSLCRRFFAGGCRFIGRFVSYAGGESLLAAGLPVLQNSPLQIFFGLFERGGLVAGDGGGVTIVGPCFGQGGTTSPADTAILRADPNGFIQITLGASFATFDQAFGSYCGTGGQIDVIPAFSFFPDSMLWGRGIVTTGVLIDSTGTVLFDPGASVAGAPPPTNIKYYSDTTFPATIFTPTQVNVGGTLIAAGGLGVNTVNATNNAALVAHGIAVPPPFP